MNDEKSYNLAVDGMRELGNSGSELLSLAFNSIGNAMDKAAQRKQELRFQKLQNQLTELENAHVEKMQKIHDEHELEMLKEQHRHEEYIIREQRKVIEQMIAAATTAYEKKLDFLNAQLECLETTYSKERDLLSEHIKFLEIERSKNMDDAGKYSALSTDIRKLVESKSKLYTEYMTAQGNLNDAVKVLEIDKSFSNSLENNQNKLLGTM